MNSTFRDDRPTVLLVEDHDGARRALGQLLVLSGFRVRDAATVREALERLDGQDFIILDLQLPDGLGLAVLRKLNDEGSMQRVAVCSGSTDPTLLDAVRRERPDRIFSKPLDFAALIEWLASRTPEPAS
jgi:two-component system KDP operon response regulator KdpE